ncbi:hypothetical protein [Bradyrhizobium elkanii]|uniref:hypothetical protein n=1 Tax=Bradyrhizobium elkanii TaxID=29448 RepID=UPI002A06F51A|nr:hypothetical protein [Bradyrhizobium elkanii]MCP1982504.1 hypothetical protein [Bradyrhizobium elkanii]MCS3882712.1 hypothetical protein [Bradyrhizobium elkanii]MCS4218231.1 hypothetical protein [Bradyrhizobium elkanii]MCW2195319.1 hypothetical protein [Bradyrhizobium elkanii]
MGQHDNGLGLREIADVSTHDREVHLSGRECLGGLKRSRRLDRLSRTGAFDWANFPAIAETSLPASPSTDPTAIVKVVGRSYQR